MFITLIDLLLLFPINLNIFIGFLVILADALALANNLVVNVIKIM